MGSQRKDIRFITLLQIYLYMYGAKNVNHFGGGNKSRESTAKPITNCHCEVDTPDKEIFDCEHSKLFS